VPVGHNRTLVRAFAATTVLVLAGSWGLVSGSASAQPAGPTSVASPAAPATDVKDVRKKVDALYASAEQASERYNTAAIRLQESTTRLKALRSDVSSQEGVVTQMRADVAALVVQQYQGNSLSTASQVVFSHDSGAFIDNLNAASSLQSQRGQVIEEYDVQLSRLALRKKAAAAEVKALGKTRTILAKEKADIDTKAAAAKDQLDKLELKQQMALLSGVDPSQIKGLDYSGRAGPALKYALAQVGKAYVWGAVGPSSYDCSGLMLAAWRQAGISLPHSSRAQQGSGRPVAESDLQPGDLVFYYSPVSHVGMYIGGGLIVNAENPSVGVTVTGLHAMPYSGAVRPG
jgi:cell wall-associated NlpC family hydrolase